MWINALVGGKHPNSTQRGCCWQVKQMVSTISDETSSNRSPAQWLGVKYAYMDARRYAERQGYMLKGTEKIWDSTLPNIGIIFYDMVVHISKLNLNSLTS